jgi:hypothetical protein
MRLAILSTQTRRELQEAREQQTATSEVLQVISLYPASLSGLIGPALFKVPGTLNSCNKQKRSPPRGVDGLYVKRRLL